VDYARRAGDRATAQVAHEEAARFYDMALQALDLMDTPDLRERAELLLLVGTAANLAGETDTAEPAFAEAAELARQLDEAHLLARIALAWAAMRWAGGGVYRPQLIALVDDAISRLAGQDDALQAKLFARNAGLHLFIDPDRVRELADQAVTAARRSGDPGALAQALTTWCWTLTQPEDRPEVDRTIAEVAVLAEEAGELELAVQHHQQIFVGAAIDGRRDEFDTALAMVIRLAEKSRSPLFMATATGMRAMVAVVDGDYETGQRLAGELLAHGRRTGDQVVVNNFGVTIYPIWRERGRVGEFESATRAVVERSPTVPAWRAGLAHLLAEAGKLEEASAELDVLAEDNLVGIPDDVSRPYTLSAMAETAAMLGDSKRAETLIAHLSPRRGTAALLGGAAYHGAIDRYLGLLAYTVGDFERAVEAHEAAVRMHEEFRSPPWVARSRCDLARALLARNKPGDRERAVALLNQALETANAVGMPKLVEEALTAKLGAQGLASSSPNASIDVVAAGVSSERPDLRPHAAADGRVTIAFSDIEGYTAMTERLGDEAMQGLLREHNAVVRRELRAHEGVEVKSQGDGFMLAFPSPEAAVSWAVATQQAMSSHDFGAERVRLRIGIHTGQAIREGSDFYGRTVIVAARVADQAHGGQILITPEIRAVVPATAVDKGREVVLKGLSGPHIVYSLAWENRENYTSSV
jgi:class 3 adenylate cyclase/tetratricopeptide (TPR) repeat protein